MMGPSVLSQFVMQVGSIPGISAVLYKTFDSTIHN